MYTLIINTRGKEFIELRKKNIKQFIYIFPILFLFSISAGFIKLGFSGYSIAIILLTFPVFFIVFQSSIIKPKNIVKNLIIKIELNETDIIFFTEDKSIKSKQLKPKSNLQIFETTFQKYYTINSNSKEYFIFPEFFDNFKIIEHNINLGAI